MLTHEDLKSMHDIDINFSGTTAVTVFVSENLVFCCNCGDSRAVIGRLARGGWSPLVLSKDHKPNDPEEKKRIEKANGRVEQLKDYHNNFVGPMRVWLKNENYPGLAMSRSIGDLVSSEVGVICVPEIIVHELDSSDKFIILASDGVWEFISNEECVNIVSTYYFSNKLTSACEEIANLAVFRWTKEERTVDDITIIIAGLKNRD